MSDAPEQESPRQPDAPQVEAAATAQPAGEDSKYPVWQLPDPDDILDPRRIRPLNSDLLMRTAQQIESTLAAVGAPAKVVMVNVGPTITQYGIEPEFVGPRRRRTKVRISEIMAAQNDLARTLNTRVRVEGPVPGEGYIGIEIPNPTPLWLSLRGEIEADGFVLNRGKLKIGLGQYPGDSHAVLVLEQLHHLLLTGASGSGRTMCLNTILASLLVRHTPDNVRFLLVDLKRIEFEVYKPLPHLLAPTIVEPEQALTALQSVVAEIRDRRAKLASAGTNRVESFNALTQARGQKQLPYWVIIIDELTDLILWKPDKVETVLQEIVSYGDALGIHLIGATQRPALDVVRRLMRHHFPTRIVFASSMADSQLVLGRPDAEHLIGAGDMLLRTQNPPNLRRAQSAAVSELEIVRLVRYWAGITEGMSISSHLVSELPPAPPPIDPDDELLNDAIKIVREKGSASVSFLQRRLQIGYSRAARLIDELEKKKIVGPPQRGGKRRDVLDPLVAPPSSASSSVPPPEAPSQKVDAASTVPSTSPEVGYFDSDDSQPG